ncbi:MAG: RND transporter, partial [Pseudomonadota bacterium]|nr:RND transporter [Pseudomonadota bacterium]
MPTMGRAAAALSAVFLAGCASLSPDGGLTDVARLTESRIGQPVSFSTDPRSGTANGDATLRALLGKTLTVDSAVRIALLNNTSLKASFDELGVSEADFVQAGRLRNPGFSFGRISGG